MYINIDKRYGEKVEMNLADYQSLNPKINYFETNDEIREFIPNETGDYVVVAISKKKIAFMLLMSNEQ